MPYGYTGKILHVDLTTGKMHVEQPQPDFYRRYMGGSAMGLHYLLRDMRAGTSRTMDNALSVALMRELQALLANGNSAPAPAEMSSCSA